MGTAMEIECELEKIVASYLLSQNSRGLVIVIVRGQFEACYCYGTSGTNGAGANGEFPVTSDTIFEIGSITKVFTATVLADMVCKGEVALHDSVRKYLPEGADLPKGFEEITLLQLATHTSGLRRLPGNLMAAHMDRTNPYAHYTTEDLTRGLETARVSARPGKVYSYSNFGMGLLGHALALAAGTNYEQLVKNRICDPLGMNDTSVSLGANQQSRLAPGHARGKPAGNWDIVALAGCGGLRSTGSDMLRFLRAQVDPNSTALKDAIRMTQTQQFGKDMKWKWAAQGGLYLLVFLAWQLLDGILTYWIPGLSIWLRILIVGFCVLGALIGACFLAWPLLGRLQRMGLGWHFDRLRQGKDFVWHNGATGGYRSYMAVAPTEQAGVVVLSNCNKSVDGIGRSALTAVISTRPEAGAKSCDASTSS
jgi:CubicO group peptidase (beta-lactamase class C family)